MRPLRLIQAWVIRRHPRLYFRLKGLRETLVADDRDFLEMHARLVEAGECLCTLRERYNLWRLTRGAARLPGALAEVGVYRGGSAQLIAAAKGDAALHLFDTFAGLPKHDATRDGRFQAGQLADTNLARVQASLSAWSNVYFHPGIFPGSAASLAAELRFKLVHLDVDLHRSTLDALRYFSNRMVRGGAILVHDYNNRTVPGTRTAVDEFLSENQAWSGLELWDSQILLQPIG